MSNGSWHDFPLTQDASYIGSGGTIGGEHTVGYYIGSADGSTAVAQIVNCPSAVPPDAPPPENQAPTFHYNPPLNTTQPQAVFNSSGVCTTAGWTPGGVWYNVGDTSGNPSGGGPVATAKAAAIANVVSAAAELDSLFSKK